MPDHVLNLSGRDERVEGKMLPCFRQNAGRPSTLPFSIASGRTIRHVAPAIGLAQLSIASVFQKIGPGEDGEFDLSVLDRFQQWAFPAVSDVAPVIADRAIVIELDENDLTQPYRGM